MRDTFQAARETVAEKQTVTKGEEEREQIIHLVSKVEGVSEAKPST